LNKLAANAPKNSKPPETGSGRASRAAGTRLRRANFDVKIKMRGGSFRRCLLAVAVMSLEPVGWLVAGKPAGWVHKEAAFAIGVAPFVIGAVCWLITRSRRKPGF
jgi:uncharacterized membrane protein